MTDADHIDGTLSGHDAGWEHHGATASLLQHGLSETLIGAFEALAEQTELDGRPRFSERILRELRRIVLCRTYASACLELGWWLWTLWRGGGPEAPLRAVYVDQITGSRRMLDAIARGALRLPAEAMLDGMQCSVVAGNDAFVLHLGRVPLWTALLELLVFVDPAVLRPVDADESPGGVANRLQRVLYGFLAEHAQPLQQQRRLATQLQWLGEQDTGDPLAAINDARILAYWCDPPEGALDVVRFRTVAEGFLCLREALLAGQRAAAAGQALAFEEWDEVLVAAEDCERWLDPDALDLSALCATPRLLTARAAQALEPVARFPEAVVRLPLTLARWQVWGALQARWIEAVKRRQRFDAERAECPDYRAWCAELVDWQAELREMGDAGLGVLLQLDEWVEVLGALVESDPALAEVLRAEPQLVKLEASERAAARLRLPALNQALQRVERALKGTARAGFKGEQDFVDPEAYRAGCSALRSLDGRLRRLLDGANAWAGNFAADRSIVLERLTRLHAGDAPRDP